MTGSLIHNLFTNFEIELSMNLLEYSLQFVIFKPLIYCFKETIGFDVKASSASRP